MSQGDKAFCLILALIIGGCVSNKAVENWHDIRVKEIQLEQDKLFAIEIKQ
ncbi:hypothetical protein VP455E521_P0013 [Vibrio phage 455E52-1]|nr:hypothetical protein VP455E521_P0013 [Vibrio phage 455E52-1]